MRAFDFIKNKMKQLPLGWRILSVFLLPAHIILLFGDIKSLGIVYLIIFFSISFMNLWSFQTYLIKKMYFRLCLNLIVFISCVVINILYFSWKNLIYLSIILVFNYVAGRFFPKYFFIRF